jgi:hypothetical protein
VTCEGLGGAIKQNGLKALIILGVDRTNLNDRGAATIGGMSTLEELNIADLKGMQDKHFQQMVKGKKNLRYLNASNNRLLTNNALAALKGATELEFLSISDVPGINNQGLVHLVKCKKLKTLMFGGTGITPEAVTELRVKHIPELNIASLPFKSRAVGEDD